MDNPNQEILRTLERYGIKDLQTLVSICTETMIQHDRDGSREITLRLQIAPLDPRFIYDDGYVDTAGRVVEILELPETIIDMTGTLRREGE